MAITEFAMRHKRLCAVLLIICVVFFNIYALQQQAHAFTLVAIGIGLLAAVAVSLAIAYGISFATSETAQTFGEAYATEPTLDADMDGFNDTLVNAVTTGEVIYNAIAEDTEDGYFYDVPIDDDAWADFVDYVHANYSAGANYFIQSGNDSYSTTDENTLMDISDGVIIDELSIYYSTNSLLYITVSDVSDTCSTYAQGMNATTGEVYSTYSNSGIESIVYIPGSPNSFLQIINTVGSAVRQWTLPSVTSISSVTSVAIDSGVTCDPDIYNDVSYDWANSGTDDRELAVDVYPAPADVTGDISLADGTGLVVDEEQVYSDAIAANPADVIDQDLTGVPEAATEATETVDTAVDDAQTYTDVQATDETETSLKGLFISKFPFCIPWDLANAFELIAAPAEAPNFEIDFLSGMDTKIGFQGDTSITFDMADYPIIGQISRWMFTIEFCIALMLATRKVMKW